MPFKAIEGTFHVTGYSPDGDSLRFKAKHEERWDELEGPRVKRNGRGHAQLRIEAIDTLETHYKNEHQPMEFAKEATDRLLWALDIRDVKWNESGTRVESAKDGTSGWILTRGAEKFGRPVSFVFGGDVEFGDGEDVFLKSDGLRESVNYRMLDEGLAYPTFYKGLFNDLRAEMAQVAAAARNSERGLWPKDRTNKGVVVNDLSSITQDNVILPKLFRRLLNHLENGGSLGNFLEQLSQHPEDILVIPDTRFTHFDNVISVDGNKVALKELPEDLVFLT